MPVGEGGGGRNAHPAGLMVQRTLQDAATRCSYEMWLQDHLVKMQLEGEKRWVFYSHVLPMRRPLAGVG